MCQNVALYACKTVGMWGSVFLAVQPQVGLLLSSCQTYVLVGTFRKLHNDTTHTLSTILWEIGVLWEPEPNTWILQGLDAERAQHALAWSVRHVKRCRELSARGLLCNHSSWCNEITPKNGLITGPVWRYPFFFFLKEKTCNVCCSITFKQTHSAILVRKQIQLYVQQRNAQGLTLSS